MALGEDVPETTGALANIGNKLNFPLGKATGSQDNINRSIAMARQLARIGLPDSQSTREYLTEHLNQVVLDGNNITRIQENGRIVRESLLMGPEGGVKLQTIWEGNKLITIKIFGAKPIN